jgi:hypothetical protein
MFYKNMLPAFYGQFGMENISSPRWTCSHSLDRYIDLRTQIPGGVAARLLPDAAEWLGQGSESVIYASLKP